MKKSFIILMVFFILVSFKAYFSVGTPWWDEAVYAGLAKNMVERHVFGINMDHQEGFRPPLFPSILAFFYAIIHHNILKLAYVINMVFVVTTAYLIFRTGIVLDDELLGILATLVFLSVSAYIFWSTKALVEPLEGFLVSLFFYVHLTMRSPKKHIILLPVVSLCILAKYTLACIGLMWFMIVLFENRKNLKELLKSKHLWAGVLIGFLILVPWLYHSYYVYGDVLGSAIYNLHLVNYVTRNMPANFYITHFAETFGIAGLLFVLGALTSIFRKYYEYWMLIMWFVLFFSLLSILVGEKQTRYMMPVVPVTSIVGAYFLRAIGDAKWFCRLAVLILIPFIVVSGIGTGVSKAWENKQTRLEIVYASETIGHGKGWIMSQNYPVYHFLTGRKVIWYPKDHWAMDEFITTYNVSFIVFDTCDYIPSWVEPYLESNSTFKKIYMYRNWCNLTVYEVLK